MNRLAILLVTLIFGAKAFAKTDEPKFNTRDLTITWEVVDNNYQNKQEALTAITITNHGKATFPANGWKIYFNSSRNFTPNATSGNAVIAAVNGDLYSFTPNAKFTEIRPGQSGRIEFVCESIVVNFTDAIENPYIVWDADPEKGYALGDFVVKSFNPTYQGLITPEVLFNQNKTIEDIPYARLTKVFPTPVSYHETGGNFTLTSSVGVTYEPAFSREANGLFADLSKLFGKTVTGGGRPDKGIILAKDASLAAEAYKLSVTANKVTITASTPTGIFYGIQSLKTLIPPAAWAKKTSGIEVPCVEVTDQPRFGHRAVMLDVARNFQNKAEVLKLIDGMALYKLNTLHLHLTDDEGWRIEIPSLPELTTVGSKRGHTLTSKTHLPPSHGSGADLSNPAGTGFYTKADYIEILKYATDRHINVIPEIEAPGHARAAIKSMDARYERLLAAGDKAGAEKYLLRDLNDKSQYRSVQYWNDNVIDIAAPSTYNFMEAVTNDLVAMYKQAGAPLETIHFGGDEVPAGVWEGSPSWLALKASHPELKEARDTWYYFYGRLNDMLKKRDLALSGWEEVGLLKTNLDGHTAYVPNPAFANEGMRMDVWNNVLGDGQEDLAYRLANGGYKVVLTCVTNLYFDMANYKSFDEPGYYWGAYLGIDKFFSFIPFDYFKNADVDKNGQPINRAIFVDKQRLTDYGKSNILGLQGALWAETVKTGERMEYMIFPKLLALAERSWAKDPAWATEKDPLKSKDLYQDDWNHFMNVLGKRELPRLDHYSGGFGFRLPKPGVIEQDGQYVANIQYPGLTIRYTTNGKEPDAKSKEYTGPVSSNGVVKFRAFDTRGRGGNVAEVGNDTPKPAL